VTAGTWQGIAAEDAEQITGGLAALLRRRARRLLTGLLRPHRGAILVTLLLVIVANLAALAGPWLVGLAIDRGIPPLMHGGDMRPLLVIVAGFFIAIAVQAVTTRAFIVLLGRFGGEVVLELRQRLFAHFQRPFVEQVGDGGDVGDLPD
jgi:ABC-type multidrug transport system fused ATPase/permease subunit